MHLCITMLHWCGRARGCANEKKIDECLTDDAHYLNGAFIAPCLSSPNSAAVRWEVGIRIL